MPRSNNSPVQPLGSGDNVPDAVKDAEALKVAMDRAQAAEKALADRDAADQARKAAEEDAAVEKAKAAEELASAEASRKSINEICWNCQNHDPKTKNRLDDDGTCDVCGFEKDKLYNGNIEADKAAQRAELARAAERG